MLDDDHSTTTRRRRRWRSSVDRRRSCRSCADVTMSVSWACTYARAYVGERMGARWMDVRVWPARTVISRPREGDTVYGVDTAERTRPATLRRVLQHPSSTHYITFDEQLQISHLPRSHTSHTPPTHLHKNTSTTNRKRCIAHSIAGGTGAGRRQGGRERGISYLIAYIVYMDGRMGTAAPRPTDDPERLLLLLLLLLLLAADDDGQDGTGRDHSSQGR
ncbi:hypothetical protein BC628DRAFT_270148 [Trametes gibbosa]|nr:hypothetical protein BC628DRAFT_270148 [Trametes gibbosa]